MATSFSSAITINFAVNYQNLNDFNNAVDAFSKSYSLALTDGTGANQAQKFFRDQRSVNASSNDDLDLAGGLTDPFGQTLTFTTIKGIWIYSDSANLSSLTIGNAGSFQFATWVGAAAHTVGPILPGGFFGIYRPDATGYAVTAGTGDILRIANGAGGTAVYDLILIGEG